MLMKTKAIVEAKVSSTSTFTSTSTPMLEWARHQLSPTRPLYAHIEAIGRGQPSRNVLCTRLVFIATSGIRDSEPLLSQRGLAHLFLYLNCQTDMPHVILDTMNTEKRTLCTSPKTFRIMSSRNPFLPTKPRRTGSATARFVYASSTCCSYSLRRLRDRSCHRSASVFSMGCTSRFESNW